MSILSKSPTTARNDVSKNEMKLRQLDNRDKAMRVFEVLTLVALVVTQLFILAKLLEVAQINKQNIENHRHQTEQLIEQSKARVEETNNLICDIILSTPRPTDGQKKACAEIN